VNLTTAFWHGRDKTVTKQYRIRSIEASSTTDSVQSRGEIACDANRHRGRAVAKRHRWKDFATLDAKMERLK